MAPPPMRARRSLAQSEHEGRERGSNKHQALRQRRRKKEVLRRRMVRPASTIARRRLLFSPHRDGGRVAGWCHVAPPDRAAPVDVRRRGGSWGTRAQKYLDRRISSVARAPGRLPVHGSAGVCADAGENGGRARPGRTRARRFIPLDHAMCHGNHGIRAGRSMSDGSTTQRAASGSRSALVRHLPQPRSSAPAYRARAGLFRRHASQGLSRARRRLSLRPALAADDDFISR